MNIESMFRANHEHKRPNQIAKCRPTAQSDGFLSSLARKMGLSSVDTTATAQTSAPKPKAADAKAADAKPADAKPPAPKATASKPAETKQAANRPPFKPSVSEAPPAVAAPAPAPAPAPKDGLVAGAQPIVQTNSFDSRFSAAK